MSPEEELKQRILSGAVTLRQLSQETGITRDVLKKMILSTITTDEERKKMEKILQENKASATIEMNSNLKNILIKILKGEMTAREASIEYGIDRETLRRKAEELANSSPEYIQYYIRYKSRRGDYSGINFRMLFVELIENNMTQTEIANKYDIPVRTVSRELEKLGRSQDPLDMKLYDIAKIYAEKNMKHAHLSGNETRLYSTILDEIKDESKFLTIPDETAEARKMRELEEFKTKVELLIERGMTRKQIADELHIGISTIRRRLLDLQELQGLKEKRQNPSNPDEPGGRE